MAQARQDTQSGLSGKRTDTAQQMPTHNEVNRQSSGNLSTRQRSGGLGRYGDPFSMLNDMRREMDRLFNNFGLGFGEMTPLFGRDFDRGMWSPQIDIQEDNGKLLISADLPGLSKDDVHCEIRDNMLILEGERKNEHRDQKSGWSERSYGHFYRTIPLPENVNPDNAKASFHDGVLKITLDAPRIEQHGGKKIEIA